MHISRSITGKHKLYVKHFLRRWSHEGGKFRKITLANLTGWSEAERAELNKALKAKRRWKGTPVELDMEMQIAGLVLGRIPISQSWRFITSSALRIFSGEQYAKIQSASRNDAR